MDHSSHMSTRKMGAYWSLAFQTVISGVIMYLVMFVMIDGLDSFYNNLNMLYMTLMMVSPMVVLMILAMRHMFPSKAANIALIAASLVAFLGSFAFIRRSPCARRGRSRAPRGRARRWRARVRGP